MENIALIGSILLKSFWFSLPAYIANMAPVLSRGVPFLNIPVDLGKTYRGKPLFGSHKTYRGFFFGIISAMIVCYIQTILYEKSTVFQNISLLDYGSTCFILLGFWLWSRHNTAQPGTLYTINVYVPRENVFLSAAEFDFR